MLLKSAEEIIHYIEEHFEDAENEEDVSDDGYDEDAEEIFDDESDNNTEENLDIKEKLLQTLIANEKLIHLFIHNFMKTFPDELEKLKNYCKRTA